MAEAGGPPVAPRPRRESVPARPPPRPPVRGASCADVLKSVDRDKTQKRSSGGDVGGPTAAAPPPVPNLPPGPASAPAIIFTTDKYVDSTTGC